MVCDILSVVEHLLDKDYLFRSHIVMSGPLATARHTEGAEIRHEVHSRGAIIGGGPLFYILDGKAHLYDNFSFAGHQIGSIYGKGEGTPMWVIGLLLFFITGPSEELFWRGYLQKNLMERFGGFQGWLVTTAIYAGVHVWSFNFMLIGAAAVAGAFWGAQYWRSGRLAPVIVSHAVWSTVIFAWAPLS